MQKVIFFILLLITVLQTNAQSGVVERYGRRTFDPEQYKIDYSRSKQQQLTEEANKRQQSVQGNNGYNNTKPARSKATSGTVNVSKSKAQEFLELLSYLFNNYEYAAVIKNLEAAKYWTGVAEGEMLSESMTASMAAYHFGSLYETGKLDRIMELYKNPQLAKFVNEVSTLQEKTAAAYLIAAYYESGKYTDCILMAEKIKDVNHWLNNGQASLHVIQTRVMTIFLQLGFCYYNTSDYLKASTLFGMLDSYLKQGLPNKDGIKRSDYVPAYIHSLTETFNAQKAVELFGEIDDSKTDPAWKFTVMSKALLYNGSYTECEKLIEQFKLDPKHSYLASLRSIDCMLYKKEYKKALELSLDLYKKDSLNIDVIIRKSMAELANKIDLDEAFLQSVKNSSKQHSLNTSITALLALQKLKKQTPQTVWKETWGPEIKRKNTPLSEPLDFYSIGTLLHALEKSGEAKLFLGYAVRDNFPTIASNETVTQSAFNPDALISTSLNSIEEAIRQKDSMAFRKFIALGHAKQISKTNLPVLVIACQVAEVYYVKKLLENGANPNARFAQSGFELPVYFYLSYGYFIKNKSECKSEILQLLANAGMKSDPQIVRRYLQMNRQEIMDEKMEKYKNKACRSCDEKIEKILLGTIK